MRVNWYYIKLLVLLALTAFLFGFSVKRNEARKVEDIAVTFTDESTPFVTRETVNKLLIVSPAKVTGTAKENLALSDMEKRVRAHPIVKNADVYVTMGGKLGVTIEQRKPIARLNGAISFYIDEGGEEMPLSSNFSAHVPLVTGASKKNIAEVYDLADFIRRDDFLTKHIIGMRRLLNGDYVLEARKLDYDIELGKVENLESKFSNYKAFYQKASKDKSLEKYSTITLKYSNQVVCAKK